MRRKDMISEIALQNPAAGVAAAALLMSLVFSVSRRLLVDQAKLKHLMSEMKRLRERMKKISKDDEKAHKALIGKSLKLNNQQMRLTLKPLAVSMLLVLLIFPWLARTFAGQSFSLPFAIPLLAPDAAVGWLGLYIIMSMPLTIIFRKVFEGE